MSYVRLLSVVLAGVISALAVQPAVAWSEFGHLSICDLAYRNLTPTSRSALQDLMQSQNGGTVVTGRDGVERRRYTSFNVGCLEEDERPRRHPRDHFINVSRDTRAIEGSNCPAGSSGNATSCIFSGIARDLELLGDNSASREDRVFALMALGHWIGDLHQPLHISFADDRGGNSINATVANGCGSVRYRPRNLHAVWDRCLLESGLFERVRQRADFNPNWSRRTITYRAVDTLLANTSLAEERQIVRGEPWQWAAASFEITLRPATRYCRRSGQQCSAIALADDRLRLDQSYLREFEDLAENRVRSAGFRLAHLLNRALDPAYRGPVANSLQPGES